MKRQHATLVCCAGVAVMAMSITMLSPLLPEIKERFQLSVQESGLLFSVNFLAFALFTLLGGVIAEYFGKKILLTVSLFGLAASCFLLVVCDNFYLVLLLMFAYGGFGGIVETFVSALISELNPENPSYYLNLSQIFFGIGAVITPIATGYILMKGYHYTLCYLALGCLALLVAAAFLFIPVPRQGSDAAITKKDLKALVSNKSFWLICICMLCYTGAEIGTWGWMSTFLKEKFQFTFFEAGLALSGFWIAMTIGRYLCGIFSKKIPIEKIILVLSLSAVAATAIFDFGSTKLYYLDTFLLGFACSSQFPFILSCGERLVKKGKNSAFALFMVSSNIGSVTVPYLMGAASDRVSTKMAMLVPAFFFLAVSVIFTVIIKNNNREA